MKPRLSICERILAALLGLLVTMASHADPAPEYKLKAAFLYNFVQLTEWPKEAGPLLHLCVQEKDPIGDALQALEGAEANGRHINIVYLRNVAAASTCEILYLGESAPIDVKNILGKLGESPVLIISDNMDLPKSGIMITMFPENQRLVFRVNTESTKRAHLTLSSRLLRLARYVD